MRAAMLGVVILAAGAAPAFAQQRKPLPLASFDARVFTTSLGADPITADDLDVATSELPGRAQGFSLGGQLYVLRLTRWTLGLGGEALRGHGSRPRAATKTVPDGPLVEQKLEGVFAFATLNFGDLDGWSYIGAGIGPMRLQAFADGPPDGPAAGKITLSFGGGARWFSTRHAAFCFDLRFYQTKAATATPVSAGRGAKRLLLMSVGVSVK